MLIKDIFNPINENAIAAFGDWQLGELAVGYITKQVIKQLYEPIDKINLSVGDKQIYKLKTSHFYIVGEFVTKQEETRFEEIFEITFKPTSIPNHSDMYMNVDGVKVPDIYKGRSIALSMYQYFIRKLKFKILGDETQYFGARKLWAKLSKFADVQVDIIDITTGNYLEQDVNLYHGSEDWDFDERVWSYDVDKKYIRLIMKDINILK